MKDIKDEFQETKRGMRVSPTPSGIAAPGQAMIWRKAAVVGGLWASLEIIVGSFFHNLQIPLAGTLLGCIGVALLVASHRRWPEKGLVWRAGLICAVMKSVSPSAVIFGPMIGIFMESILLEAGLRLFMGSRIGYIAGAAAAISWPLVQKAASLLITFGFNIVELYVRLYEFAAARLQIEDLGAMDLILLLLAAQAVLGAVAGFVGLEIGRRARGFRSGQDEGLSSMSHTQVQNREAKGRKYAPALLVLNLFGMVAGFILLEQAPPWAAAAYIIIYAGAVAFHYSSSLKRLKRLRFWVPLALVMILSGYLLGGLQGASGGSTAGLMIGLKMCLRAALVILGFSVAGIELRNPAILRWFARRRLRNLIRSIEIAFQALPTLTAALTRQKGLWKSPLTAAANLIGHLDLWLTWIERLEAAGPRHFIISGELQQGKTTLVTRLAEELRARGFRVAGLLALGIWDEGKRDGFDALNLATGARVPLCRRDAPEAALRTGPFGFFEQGMSFGADALSLEAAQDADLVVIDEVGPLELRGEGWAVDLDILRHNSPVSLLLVVRSGLVGEVIEHWALQDCRTFRLGEEDPLEIVAELAQAISARRAVLT
jgi:nucleoside-triphosphatase THEP1